MTEPVLSRRAFLGRGGTALAGGALLAAGARGLLAQVAGDSTDVVRSPATNLPMDQEAARTVRRPPKPGARASMTAADRDALEHRIRCQCGCTLDVYTCRTTDFTCQVSPAMHRDVLALVEGGYTADEILDAFVESYGERALMAPKKEGFNWLGYIMPFAALGAGAVVVATVVRRWRRPVRGAEVPATVPARGAGVALPLDATPEELASLDAAVRRDEDA